MKLTKFVASAFIVMATSAASFAQTAALSPGSAGLRTDSAPLK